MQQRQEVGPQLRSILCSAGSDGPNEVQCTICALTIKLQQIGLALHKWGIYSQTAKLDLSSGDKIERESAPRIVQVQQQLNLHEGAGVDSFCVLL